MLSFLLNPKNLAIIILSITCLVLGGLWQWESISSGKLQNKVDGLNGIISQLRTEVATLNSVIEDLKKNIDAVKVSAEEMQRVEAQTTVLRKKIKKLEEAQVKPYDSGGKLEVEYAKVASDITGLFNSGMRGKVTSPRSGDGKTAPEVLPDAGKAGNDKPGNNESVTR
jgi:exonuclease VII small subunit